MPIYLKFGRELSKDLKINDLFMSLIHDNFAAYLF